MTTLPQISPNSNQKLLNESWMSYHENIKNEIQSIAKPPPSFYQFLEQTMSFKLHPWQRDHLVPLLQDLMIPLSCASPSGPTPDTQGPNTSTLQHSNPSKSAKRILIQAPPQ